VAQRDGGVGGIGEDDWYPEGWQYIVWLFSSLVPVSEITIAIRPGTTICVDSTPGFDLLPLTRI
jgi:hypothetical protein